MTRLEVENACKKVIGTEEFLSLKSCGLGLPEILRHAGLKVFQEDWPNEGFMEHIRGALNMLDKDGFFSFDNESAELE